MPNKENITALADFISQHPELPFDMGQPTPVSCGSAGCIGGFAGTLWPDLATTGEVKWVEEEQV